MSRRDSTRITQFLHLLFLVFLDERWKPVPGWRAYEVSSWGRVRSFWKRTFLPGRKVIMSVGEKSKILRQGLEPKTGHYHVTLGQDGKQSTFKTSRLVLMAFSRQPNPEEEARHYFDDDPSNCHFWNLQWGTKAENIEDYRRHHGNHQSAKITPESVAEIRSRSANGESQVELAREYGVTTSNVSMIVNHKTWQHLLNSATS